MKKPELIDLHHISHDQGLITVAENNGRLPFPVKRVYWLTHVKNGQVRGKNATLEGQRILVAVNGKAKVRITNLNQEESIFTLEHAEQGLYVPELHWTEIQFQEQCILVCLVSNLFDESDYIRSFDDFLAIKTGHE